MKKIIYSSVVIIATLFTACDLNDSMDDAVIVGKMAPHVYWEVGSSTVSAGSNVPFIVQYYNTGKEELDKLEVWYNLVEDESKAVSCPWTATFTYSVTSNKSVQKRISQKISEYPHVSTYWSDSLRAFSFKSTFPTSNTLATTSWVKPSTYDNNKMLTYYGQPFMTQFKDSLYKLMKVTDFQKMYLGLGLVDNFKIYIDSTKNNNTGGWDYHFPKDAQGNTPVPQIIINLYQNIPFSDLILNKSTNTYDVEYIRSYKIKAIIKALDKKGTAGVSMSTDISLN
ncbi:MAG: hypothetical protein Q7U47_00775 [Paludibacter sp.]|nr:hypothetical protein [Paludibacter sp.]